jgi:uncharacterized delta-60 repeat protein
MISGYGMDPYMNDFVIARFTSSGVPDSTFDFDGKLTTDVFGSIDRGRSILVQPDGKILVTGYARQDLYHSGAVLIRYNNDGSFDQTFATNGIAYTPFNPDAEGWDLLLQPDGKIVVTGEGYLDFGDTTEIAVLRFLNDIALNTQASETPGSQFMIYPNPLSDNGVMQFSLSENDNIEISLFNLEGIKINTIIESNFEAGSHHLPLQKENLNVGVYFVQLKSKNGIAIRKLIIQ